MPHKVFQLKESIRAQTHLLLRAGRDMHSSRNPVIPVFSVIHHFLTTCSPFFLDHGIRDGSPSPVLRLRMDQAHTLSTSSSNPQLLSSQHPPAHLMPSGSAPDLAASMSRGPSPVSGMPPAAPPARKVRGQRGTSSGGASSSTAEPSLPRSSTTPPRPIPFLSANKSREQLTAQSAAQKSGSHATLGQQAGFHVRQPSSMQGSFAATARRRGSDDQSAFLYNNLRGDSPQGRTTHLVAGTVGSRSSELNVARQFAAQR